jgi:hypothetical protein
MEIIVDPFDSKKIKLVKHPRNMWVLATIILAVGAIFVLLFKSYIAFVPFLVIVGISYIFGGNYFEISVDFEAGEIYRRSHDMLHITDFYRAVKIVDIQKIWLIPHYSGSSQTSSELVIVWKKLCSVSYGPDREEIRKFSFVLAELVHKDFDTEPEKTH